MFTALGVPVLTADSIPGAEEVDLRRNRLDIANNYHARMLSTAILAARSAHLEYVQIVSFGCGHDAYLSDEIVRLMDETSGKAPLILKLDESDIQVPLRIRVRSFLETVEMRRLRGEERAIRELRDPIIHHTFDAGEGVLISGEILHHAKHGCRAFVILQPFGCLPNHVVGRGVAKQLKKLYPDAQILPLDYDPDVSFANIENRLQMLVMNARQEQECIVRVKTGVALA